MRLCILSTIPATPFFFMADFLRLAAERGHELHLICGNDSWVTAEQLAARYKLPVHVVPFTRRISPLTDLIALVKTWRLLRRLRPDVALYSTPKASLLAALACRLAGVKRTVYTNRGLLAADQPGLRGLLWRTVERVICGLSTAVTCNSASNQRFMIDRRICRPPKLRVLAKGSSHGVDAAGRFNPANIDGVAVRALRESLHLPCSSPWGEEVESCSR